MNDFLKTTKQLAAECGITPEQLRQLKHKHSDRFIDGSHYIKDEAGNLWTADGESVVRQLLGINDPVASHNDPVAQLEYLEHQIAEIIADDALPIVEPKLNSDRINRKALDILAQKLAAKMRTQNLEHWQLVTEHLCFTPDGVAGSLPSGETANA